jgi:hypothetical protein
MARLAEVAQKLGYALGQRGAERRFGPCPACGEGKDDAALNVEAEVWKCHRASCQEGGGTVAFVAWHVEGAAWRDLTPEAKRRVRAQLELHGVEQGGDRRPAEASFPPPPPAPRNLTAAARWEELLAAQHPVAPEALTWLRGRFGDELADAIVNAPLPVVAAPVASDPFWRWVHQDLGYRLAIPVTVWSGPDKGRVADFRLRWCGPGPAPGDGKRKEVGLANAITDAGRLARFMGAPTRVTPSTPVIVIVEGGADYLAAEALRRAGQLPMDWAVVGLPGAGTARNLGEALAAHLTDLEDREEPTGLRRVILAIDADDGGDRACRDLYAELERSGALVAVHRAGQWAHGHDLGDRLTLLGPEATAREIVSAGPYAPPVLTRVPTIYGDAEPIPLDQARRGLPGLLAGFIRAAIQGARTAAAFPFGGGKTTAALHVAIMRAEGADLPPLVIALASWELVRQKRKELLRLAESRTVAVKIDKLVGVGEGCHDGKHPDTGAPVRARTAYLASGQPPSWRRLVCKSCPLRKRCPAQKRPLITSDVVFTTHASLAHLPKEWAGRFVIIIDEAAKAVEVTTWTVAHLQGPAGAVWDIRDRPETLDALDTLYRAWDHALRDPALAVLRHTHPARHLQRTAGGELGSALVGAARDAGGEAVSSASSTSSAPPRPPRQRVSLAPMSTGSYVTASPAPAPRCGATSTRSTAPCST